MRRSIALLVLGCALRIAPTPRASAESRPAYGGSAQGALSSAPGALDPLRPSPGDDELAALLFDAPFRLDAAGRPRPHLAQALDAPAGALRARLILRTDVHFSDGTPLRAHDVAASLTRGLREPGGWVLGPIRSARAVGEDQVEIELSRPAPDLPLLLSTLAASVTPGGAAPGRRPVGTGPFVLESADAQQARLRPSPGCFGGRAYLDALTLRSFRSRAEEVSSLHVGTLSAARHDQSAFGVPPPGRAPVEVDGPITLVGFVALSPAVAADEALRSAVHLGIDRQRLRRLAVRESSVVAASLVPPALGGVPGRVAYDPARARTLLAGWRPATPERGQPGRPTLGLLVDASRFDDREVADHIQADLSRVGIELNIEVVDAPVYQSRLAAGRYDLLLGLAGPPLADGGLAELSLLGAIDPEAARALLARAPAAPGLVDAAKLRLEPLFFRAARLYRNPELRGLTVDAAGRASWAEAHLSAAQRAAPGGAP